MTTSYIRIFVNSIHCFGPDYNDKFSRFTVSLPVPVKCPYSDYCKGGIDSECHEGYQGNLCATSASGFFLRFNTCLKCPWLTVTIISAVVVIAVFVVVFLMVLWGDSKRTRNDRTAAEVIMRCFKIVIGFYQVIIGSESSRSCLESPHRTGRNTNTKTAVKLTAEIMITVNRGNFKQLLNRR